MAVVVFVGVVGMQRMGRIAADQHRASNGARDGLRIVVARCGHQATQRVFEEGARGALRRL